MATLIGNGAKVVALAVLVLRLIWYIIMTIFTSGGQIISSSALIDYV